MKQKRFAIIIHILVWLVLCVTIEQVTESLDSDHKAESTLLGYIICSIFVITFYFNYLFLIPKFLLVKKGKFYFPLLLTMIVIVFLFLGIIFFVPHFTPQVLAKANPIIEKIIPVIIINTVSLWLLSIVLSILWFFYNRLKQTENERLAAQIALLKSQINPHFLFNTLNNIYATTIDTSPKAADMIDKLSEMMRYTMRNAQLDFVLLEDEINYISNFIELQKMRLDKSVKLKYYITGDIPPLQIAPMLLIPFIENAFKYGVNSEQKSYIEIKLRINENEFQLNVINNKVNVQQNSSEKNGLGIENTKHRLNLIYPSNHLLIINDNTKQFIVSLYIKL